MSGARRNGFLDNPLDQESPWGSPMHHDFGQFPQCPGLSFEIVNFVAKKVRI